MQIVYYTIAGILLYLLSDWILVRVEAWRGAAFEQRSLIFFVVILVLALTSFKAIELWFGG
ncbi:MAG: hypothetical protein PVI79_13055 [Gammaproteobacteria bacterium]|jgi:hypothetical protein